jgi:bifunctional non-homologous end joining protein LigD
VSGESFVGAPSITGLDIRNQIDGFCSLAAIENGTCNLISREANAFKRFPDVRIALPNDLKGVAEAVIDSEIVVLDERGASQFYPLMSSSSKPIYAAFDLVCLNGEDLSDLPLVQRKKRLRSIVRKAVEKCSTSGDRSAASQRSSIR